MPRAHAFRSTKPTSRALRTLGLALGLTASLAMPVAAQSSDTATADERVEQYSRLLQQIDDTRLTIARQEVMLARQQENIAALQAQVERLPNAEAEIVPVLTRFVGELEQLMESDVPFQLGERFERLSALREQVGEEAVPLGTKLGNAMQMANIEAVYGYEITSYEDNHPTDERRRYNACLEDIESAGCAMTDSLRSQLEGGASIPQLDDEILDGDYLRYGRLSLAYVDKGTDDVLVFDPAAREWRDARGSELANIRRNLRMARGEAAPDVIEAPVVKLN